VTLARQNRRTLHPKPGPLPASISAPAPGGPSRRLSVGICISLILAGAMLRIRGARNDLWLDEIWSLKLAQSAKSVMEIFTRLHHDNNNYLNTLYLYLAPNRGNWWGYRFLSIAAGIGR
jgi:hypothetical protein